MTIVSKFVSARRNKPIKIQAHNFDWFIFALTSQFRREILPPNHRANSDELFSISELGWGIVKIFWWWRHHLSVPASSPCYNLDDPLLLHPVASYLNGPFWMEKCIQKLRSAFLRAGNAFKSARNLFGTSVSRTGGEMGCDSQKYENIENTMESL